MNILVTGTSGHLGEALARTLQQQGHRVVGLDIAQGAYTTHVGSIADAAVVAACMQGVNAVLHTATLHKPHIVSHTRQDFIDTNITGTLRLLEEAVRARVKAFIYTSTTSVFGAALVPPPGAPAGWVTEAMTPKPKNIYGVTKAAAEDLCELFHRDHGLACLVLRTSRFFPEGDDEPAIHAAYPDDNLKVNEYLHRRVDIEDAVSAHMIAINRAPDIGFRRYIITATTPFTPDDLSELRVNAPAVVRRRAPGYEAAYALHGWKMLPTIDRVYVNALAREELGWRPTHDFASVVARLANGDDTRSALAREIGWKGYHPAAGS